MSIGGTSPFRPKPCSVNQGKTWLGVSARHELPPRNHESDGFPGAVEAPDDADSAGAGQILSSS